MEPFPLSFQALQSVAGRDSQIFHIYGIVEVEKLASRGPMEFGWKESRRFTSLVVEQFSCQNVAKRLNHVRMLSKPVNNDKVGNGSHDGFLFAPTCWAWVIC